MQEIKYKVMLLNPQVEKTKELLEKLNKGTNGTDGLDIAKKAYATEVSLITEQPVELFGVGDGPICVAFTEKNEVLGFISVGIDTFSKTVVTEHVYVRPEVRKKGVYGLMLERVKKLAEDIGAKRIVSFVFNKNKVSKTAHENKGFKKKMTGYIMEVKNGKKE